ncbi:hypothetical protein DOTSEDRAFT_70401 [Dothistroma septosporum NZE10]|uniref:Uncharacterized protein n=1 Tax=Dothistroma septosporum (strain NZE10 / CBS 128990) TaxID=675120 RepID=N1PVK1_DOTSN|nr:hypothetical protein DOTSEDRAFT_70401 [Dothistroma septosporum NZE10]
MLPKKCTSTYLNSAHHRSRPKVGRGRADWWSALLHDPAIDVDNDMHCRLVLYVLSAREYDMRHGTEIQDAFPLTLLVLRASARAVYQSVSSRPSHDSAAA